VACCKQRRRSAQITLSSAVATSVNGNQTTALHRPKSDLFSIQGKISPSSFGKLKRRTSVSTELRGEKKCARFQSWVTPYDKLGAIPNNLEATA